MMESVRGLEKRYCTATLTVAIIMGFFFIIIGQKPIGKGLLLGAVFSVINFILMGETLRGKLGKTKVRTVFSALGSIAFRFTLLAIPIILALKSDQFEMISTISGIFAIQIVILADHLIGSLFSNQRKFF